MRKNVQILKIVHAFSAFILLLFLNSYVRADVRFDADFPGARMGKVEKIDGEPNTFRVPLTAQSDEKNLNRQATWFAFRISGLKNAQEGTDSNSAPSVPLTLVFCDFDGCYDGHLTHPSWEGVCPVFSNNEGAAWEFFKPEECEWNAAKRTLRVRFTPQNETIRIAYTAMYTLTELKTLMEDVQNSPFVRVETIGFSLEKRPIPLFALSDFSVKDSEKRHFYIMARQHAWEAHTSWQADGMIRFLISEKAIELRKTCVFYIVPIVDVDGAENGAVRFNGLGFDVNRRWNEVDLTSEISRSQRPECWYNKQKILKLNSEKPLTLVVNLHNDTATDYIDACGPTDLREKFVRFEKLLTATGLYDPRENKPIRILQEESDAVPTTFSLWWDDGIPMLMVEQKVNLNGQTHRFPTILDSRNRGARMVEILAQCF